MFARSAITELDRCGDEELAHIARDVGLAPADLCAIAANGPDQENLLGQRLVAVGLSTAELGHSAPQTLRDLERVCSQCAARGRCSRDLASNAADRRWREYCPNVATIDALRSEERDRRRWSGNWPGRC